MEIKTEEAKENFLSPSAALTCAGTLKRNMACEPE